MARMAARKGTGTKDWYAKFTRDGKSAGKLGPYVTRRAALEDAKVVLRAKVRGLVDEAGEPVRVLRVRDANNNEAGYEASDGSISVITASSGKATFNERVNPSAHKAAHHNPAKPKKKYRYRSDDDPRTPYYSYAEKKAQKVFSKAFDGLANVVYSESSYKPQINSMDESKGHIPLWFGSKNPYARVHGFFGVIQAEKNGYLFYVENRAITTATGTPEAAFTLMLAQARPWLDEHLRLYATYYKAKSAVWEANKLPRGQRGKPAAIAAAEADVKAVEQAIAAHGAALPHRNPRRRFGRMR